MTYIQGKKTKEICILCNEISKIDGPENLVVFRGQYAFVILNRYPYASGHLMVVPFMHNPSLEDLDRETRADLMELTAHALTVLRLEYNPKGFNVGINIGESAGAGILDHIHIHIVPRWSGDTNFMSTLANTRLLPEPLEDTYSRIKQRWLETNF
jgi:ATP adenylyltransferase